MQFILHPENFKGQTKVVTAPSGSALMAEVRRVYALEQIPDHVEIHIWSGYGGVRRLRLDTLSTFDPAVVQSHMARVRLVIQHQDPVPDEQGPGVE